MRSFDSLSEREILALAISLEEEDERVYAEYAEGLRQNFPASAAVFDGMREEESGHRRRLIELFRQKFGEHIPLIRRQDVRGFVHRNPVWLMQPLGLDTVRNQASAMEVESRRFYEKAAARAQDAGVRQLLDDLAQEERTHEDRAEELEKTKLQPDVKQQRGRSQPAPVRAADRAAGTGWTDGRLRLHARAGVRRGAGHAKQFRRVQGGARGVARRGHQHGLRGSAFGRWQPHRPRPSVGARHRLRADDRGGRHRPHAAVSDPKFSPGDDCRGAGGGCWSSGVISWIRHRYMDTPPVSAVLQVGLGGVLVFLTGVLIGSS